MISVGAFMEKSQAKLLKLINQAYETVKKSNISDERLKVEAFNFALRVLWDEQYGQKAKAKKS